MLQDLVDVMEDGVALFDAQMNFVVCNQMYVDMMLPDGSAKPTQGSSAVDVISSYIQGGKIPLPDHLSVSEFAAERLNWAMEFGPPTEFTTTDGRILMSSSKPTRLGSFLITLRDVTRERQSDHLAQTMLLDAFEAFEEGLVLCDEQMRFVFANQAWLKMTYGAHPHLTPKRGDLVMDKVREMVDIDFYDIPAYQSKPEYPHWMMGEMAQHGKQVAVNTADGRNLMGSSHLTAYGGALLVVRDVTQQRQTERELSAQREAAQQAENYQLWANYWQEWRMS